MTTIIADCRTLTMGADRLVHDGGMRYQASKVERLDVASILHPSALLSPSVSVLAGFGGAFACRDIFFRWVASGMPLDDTPPSPASDSDFEALVLTADATLYSVEWNYAPLLLHNVAFHVKGSGRMAGMAAMLLGCSVSQALQICHRVDISTGFEHDVLTLPRQFK